MALDMLKISSNGRHLVDQSDNPFFLLGDDIWAGHLRLSYAEFNTYLSTRKTQGFNCAHLWLIATWQTTNQNGDSPFSSSIANTNTSVPLDSAFWNFMDSIIQLAEDQGFYIMLQCGSILRTALGNFCTSNFSNHTAHKEKTYRVGYAIADRLKSHSNIIFGTGMDMHPERCNKVGSSNCANNGANYKDLCKHLAKGLADGWNGDANDYTSTSQNFSTCPLITWHPGNITPDGGTSSGEFFHTDSPDWCAFNMAQGGRQEDPGDDRYLDNVYTRAAADWARSPAKPTGDGEVYYEDSGIPDEYPQRHTSYHVRIGAYWSVFAGSTYHCYGHLSVWQVKKPQFPDRGDPAPRMNWDEALTADGAADMKHLVDLLSSRPQFAWEPDQTVFNDSEGSNETRLQAIREVTGQYAMIYITNGKTITINATKIAGSTIVAWWFDPRTGTATKIGEYPTSGTQQFNPPGNPSSFNTNLGNDWVLVLDNKARGYSAPGTETTPPATLSALVGHRGGADERPENTLAAFRYCYGLGGNLETDVRLSADNVPMCIHDSTANRTTDLSGSVSGFTQAQLEAADAGSHFDPAYSSEGVPSLEDVISDMMSNAPEHIFIIVDTKVENSIMYNALRTILNTYDAWNRVFIEVSNDSVANAIRAVDSRFRLSIWAPNQSDINSAIADGRYERIATHDTQAQLVDEIQASGALAQLGVHTHEEWCVNVVNVASSLPDAIHTDAPFLMKGMIQAYGLEVPD